MNWNYYENNLINYKKLVKSLNKDIQLNYGNDFIFQIEYEKDFHHLELEVNFLNTIYENGILYVPKLYDYSVIELIHKHIISFFEMFYLCCYEIKTKVELEFKIIALLP